MGGVAAFVIDGDDGGNRRVGGVNGDTWRVGVVGDDGGFLRDGVDGDDDGIWRVGVEGDDGSALRDCVDGDDGGIWRVEENHRPSRVHVSLLRAAAVCVPRTTPQFVSKKGVAAIQRAVLKPTGQRAAGAKRKRGKPKAKRK